MSITGRLQPSRMRRKLSTRNSPTPAATVKISTRSGTAGVCLASTARSGSATVTSTPMRKQPARMSHSLRVRVRWVPTSSPMGIMAMSAPRVKKPMPRMSRAAPARNRHRVERSTGTTKAHSASTMRLTGSTAARDSWIFSLSCLFKGIASFDAGGRAAPAKGCVKPAAAGGPGPKAPSRDIQDISII